jgi:hypothetical protein
MKNLRDYQIQIANQGVNILSKYKILYLIMQVRTGKTATALEIAKLYNANNVLFTTKKRAISSIQNDFKDFNYKFDITIINNESLHKITSKFDLVISDEHHRLGAFPKCNKFYKELLRFKDTPMIFLSGTPAVESASQWYHQFDVSNFSPFTELNFYKWAKTYVNVKKKFLGYAEVNDYSDANLKLIEPIIEPYLIRFTQEQAGFSTSVNLNPMYCTMQPKTQSLINRLKRDLCIQGTNELIIADTAVKLQSKIHQLCSGTIKFESGNSMVTDYTKAEYIKQRFTGVKIAIFYYYKAEYDMIKQIFGDNITDDLDTFNNSTKSIALQQYAGAEGISLKNAEVLIFLNFGFSGVKFIQAIDRLTTMERKSNDVYFLFSNKGIEEKVFKAVKEKENYNVQLFKKDYEISN